ncbi:fibroblast growth factor receptor 3-like [Oscarella lobularis]|uniref:fibroblast growth factor receptor 3-like n=1 Tax=Oscarella lobularis TaxID=121494 RepID=UPI003313712E
MLLGSLLLALAFSSTISVDLTNLSDDETPPYISVTVKVHRPGSPLRCGREDEPNVSYNWTQLTAGGRSRDLEGALTLNEKNVMANATYVCNKTKGSNTELNYFVIAANFSLIVDCPDDAFSRMWKPNSLSGFANVDVSRTGFAKLKLSVQFKTANDFKKGKTKEYYCKAALAKTKASTLRVKVEVEVEEPSTSSTTQTSIATTNRTPSGSVTSTPTTIGTNTVTPSTIDKITPSTISPSSAIPSTASQNASTTIDTNTVTPSAISPSSASTASQNSSSPVSAPRKDSTLITIIIACACATGVTVVAAISILLLIRYKSRVPPGRWIDKEVEEQQQQQQQQKQTEVEPNFTIKGISLPKRLLIPREEVCLSEKLGEGYFGVVMKASRASQTVAVKIAKQRGQRSIQKLAAEVSVWTTIGCHENVIGLLGVCCLNGGGLWIVMEYAEKGNLLAYIRAAKKADTLSYGLQIAKGMEHLASKMCIHRDLAARNILVCHNDVLKISDFGLTKDVHYFEYYRLHQPDAAVPIKWTAPEVMFDKVYTEESDVWSFGIVLWEIATLGCEPYPSIPTFELCNLLMGGYRMPKPLNCSNCLYDGIILSCWKERPEKRPKFSVIVSSLQGYACRTRKPLIRSTSL